MVTRKIIAVIPARGGSKRIPRKNIVDFFGRPLIAWTIDAALGASVFDRVLVSTDDPEIADVARSCGVNVPFLRNRAADDAAHASAATLAALDQVREQLNEDHAVVVQLMPNCPLRGSTEILSALDRFYARSASFQISCFRYGWMNPWWAVRLDENGVPKPVFGGALSSHSQNLDTLYCPTGAIWIAETAALRAAGTFYGPDHTFEPMHWTAAVDIDDAEDLEMARAVFSMRKSNGDG